VINLLAGYILTSLAILLLTTSVRKKGWKWTIGTVGGVLGVVLLICIAIVIKTWWSEGGDGGEEHTEVGITTHTVKLTPEEPEQPLLVRPGEEICVTHEWGAAEKLDWKTSTCGNVVLDGQTVLTDCPGITIRYEEVLGHKPRSICFRASGVSLYRLKVWAVFKEPL